MTDNPVLRTAAVPVSRNQYYIGGELVDLDNVDEADLARLVPYAGPDHVLVSTLSDAKEVDLTIELWEREPPQSGEWDQVERVVFQATASAPVMTQTGAMLAEFGDVAWRGPGEYSMRVHARAADREEHLIQVWPN